MDGEIYLDGKRLKVWESRIGNKYDYIECGIITNIYFFIFQPRLEEI